MPKKINVEPDCVLAIIVDNTYINGVIRKDSVILDYFHINIISSVKDRVNSLRTRQSMLNEISRLYNQYKFDTLLIENCELFVNTMSKYPSSNILKNILLEYDIKITLENEYLDKVKYFICLDSYEWIKYVFNFKNPLSIDFYKEHVLNLGYQYNEILKDVINKYNLYKVLCFSECAEFTALMHKKFCINLQKEK